MPEKIKKAIMKTYTKKGMSKKKAEQIAYATMRKKALGV